MSQQINLLDPALRIKRDYLSLPVLVAICAFIVLVEAVLYVRGGLALKAMQAQETVLMDEGSQLQENVLNLSRKASELRPDSALQARLDQRKADIRLSEDVAAALRSMASSENGFSGHLAGFSRQAINGMWLTEFALAQDGLTIKGRLLDIALLPPYIRRLNSEPVFRGRNFAALDMAVVEPEKTDVRQQGGLGSTKKPAAPAFTEFSLRSTAPSPRSGFGAAADVPGGGDVVDIKSMLAPVKGAKP